MILFTINLLFWFIIINYTNTNPQTCVNYNLEINNVTRYTDTKQYVHKVAIIAKQEKVTAINKETSTRGALTRHSFKANKTTRKHMVEKRNQQHSCARPTTVT